MATHTHYLLNVYIAGMTPVARTAIRNLEQICRTLEDPDRYRIEVVDVLEHPELAEKEMILATPTVIRKLPPPIRRMVGDLSEHESVLVGLELALD